MADATIRTESVDKIKAAVSTFSAGEDRPAASAS